MSLRVRFSPASLTFVASDRDNVRSSDMIIPGAPSDATVTFDFLSETTPKDFAVTRVRVFDVVRLPNSSQIAELDLVSESDGSTGVDVSRGQFIVARVAYVGPALHPGIGENDQTHFFATLIITGTGLSVNESWSPVRVPLTVFPIEVVTTLEDRVDPFKIVQGQGKDLSILVTSLVSPTNASYRSISSIPEITMVTKTIPVPTGQIKHERLHFDASFQAPVGTHSVIVAVNDTTKEPATDFFTVDVTVLRTT